jgi:hypothetical protein
MVAAPSSTITGTTRRPLLAASIRSSASGSRLTSKYWTLAPLRSA